MKRLMITAVAAAAFLLSACEVQPVSDFFTDKVRAEIGEDVHFYNNSFNAVEYEWDFGDGTWSDAYEPVHSYSGSGVFTAILTAWSKSGNVDKSFVDIEVLSPTMLEIEVLEWYDQYPVEGASVILYGTESDWDNAEYPIVEGFTNASGKVIFTDLGPYVYYVDVWHPNYNNYTLRNEDVGFIRIPQLHKNELNQFVAWVDYTGTKGSEVRDRSQLLPLKNRSSADVIRK